MRNFINARVNQPPRRDPQPGPRPNRRARRWLWFIGIYAASVVLFGAVTGLLSLLLP